MVFLTLHRLKFSKTADLVHSINNSKERQNGLERIIAEADKGEDNETNLGGRC